MRTKTKYEADEIIGGVITGHLTIKIGSQQTAVMRNAGKIVAAATGTATASGESNGAMKVVAKLWTGSKKVTALIQQIATAKRIIKSTTLPWKKGEVIFKASRAEEIDKLTSELFAGLDMVIAGVDNMELSDGSIAGGAYEGEVNDALIWLGTEGKRDLFPETFAEFKGLITKSFPCSALATSDKLADLVGGALGQKMAMDQKLRMEDEFAESQGDAILRIKEWLERMQGVCDPGRDKSCIRQELFDDLNGLITNIPQLLLYPDPEITGLVNTLEVYFGGFTKDGLSESKTERSEAYERATETLNSLAECGLVL